MSKRDLQSYQELYEFLIQLKMKFDELHEPRLSEVLYYASRFIIGSPTEFMGESRLALKEVVQKDHASLTEEDIEEIKHVIDQIDEGFRRIGGA